MKLENLMTSEEMKEARVPQAFFGRIIGVSKMRVTQLIKAGLVVANADGVKLIASLKNWYWYQGQKGSHSLERFVDEYIATDDDEDDTATDTDEKICSEVHLPLILR